MIPAYRGMSYEQASKEGLRLVQKAAETGNWFEIIEPLQDLRSIMEWAAPKQKAKASA